MSKRYVTALAACCVLVWPAFGDDHEGHSHGDGHSHDADPAAMQKVMEMMQPGAEHAKMDHLVGTWKTTTTHAMTGEESEGTYTFEWSLGKRLMVGRFSGTMMGQAFEGMSLDGYDNMTGEYYSLWMDTMGTGYTAFTGQEDGEDTVVYTGTGKDPMSGADVHYRSIAKRTGDDSFSFTMFMTQGGQEMKVMEMTATRM